MERLVPASSLLLVVDLQERLAAAMPRDSLERIVKNANLLLEAAAILKVPVVASEQYPKGLGPTLAPIRQRLSKVGAVPIDKLSFAASAEPRIAREIARISPRAIIVAGMEAHVCVFQTVRELARRGHVVHVVADAVASRTEENRRAGLALTSNAGATVTVAEAVVFDWLERAGTEAFRAVSKLVR